MVGRVGIYQGGLLLLYKHLHKLERVPRYKVFCELLLNCAIALSLK